MAASPRPLISRKPCLGSADDFGERAECLDQLLGERLDVALRNGAEQHQFQQLVIGEGIGPGLAEALAQPFAMPVIMRRGVFKAGGRLAVAAGFFNSPHMTSHPKHDAIGLFCNAEMLGKVANRRGRPCFAGL